VCEVVDSNEPVSMLEMTLNDPSSIDCALFEGSGLDNVKVDFFHLTLLRTSPMLLTRVI